MASETIPIWLWEKLFEKEPDRNVSAKLLAIHTEGAPILISIDDTDYQVSVQRASEVGDNFASDVYRITVRQLPDGKELSTFAKVLPHQRAMRNVARVGKTHDREIQIYHDLLPLYFDLIRGHEGIILKVPKMYYSRLDETVDLGNTFDVNIEFGEHDPELGDRNAFEFMFEFLPEDGSERILVVEDLRQREMTMLPKAEGHSLDKVQATLEALAHWHAIGVALLKKIGSPPPGMPFFNEKTVYDTGSMFLEFVETQKVVLERIGEPVLGQKLLDLAPKIEASLEMSLPGTQGQLETIIHGDFWTNNIMYKLSEHGKVEDLVMIDFQIARIGHPCDDLGFYLYGNTTADFRERHLSDVLHVYYETVIAVLLKLGLDLEKEGYSEQKFREEWKERLLRMFMFGVIVTSSVTSKKKDVQESMDKGENMIDQLAQMLASIPDEKQREEMKKQIQEQGKKESFMTNPDLLAENAEFVDRFGGLAREILSQLNQRIDSLTRTLAKKGRNIADEES